VNEGVEGSDTGPILAKGGGARGEATSTGIVDVDDGADSTEGMSIFKGGVADALEEFDTFDTERVIGVAAAAEGVMLLNDNGVGGTKFMAGWDRAGGGVDWETGWKEKDGENDGA
jgi:hypothetical protein